MVIVVGRLVNESKKVMRKQKYGKRTDIKESYHEFKEIYSNYPIIENNKIQNVVTEEVSYKYRTICPPPQYLYKPADECLRNSKALALQTK